jgi:RNA polymerase sigma-70 factor (ECF subfamily)
MTEKQLIESCRKGNRLAQQELYQKYSGKMMGVCLRYLGDRETARDVLQDGFVRVFSSLNGYSGIGSFEGWIRRIIVNTALEHLRKNDILKEAADIDCASGIVNEDCAVMTRLSAEEILKLVAELPTGFRTVFNLFSIEGYSHKEIGEMLGITESTSRSQLTRAKAILQRKIKEYFD